MTLFVKMIVLYAVMAIAFFVVGVETPFQTLVSGEQGFIDLLGTSGAGFFISIAVVSGAIIAASMISFGTLAPLVIFAPFAAFFLTFLTFPASIFNSAGLPDEVSVLVQGFYTLMNIIFGLALVGWLKGND